MNLEASGDVKRCLWQLELLAWIKIQEFTGRSWRTKLS